MTPVISAGGVEKAGYEVQTSENGATALVAAREEAPDLVLLDLKLPDLDGAQLMRRRLAGRRLASG